MEEGWNRLGSKAWHFVRSKIDGVELHHPKIWYFIGFDPQKQ
jgi:hypothetical protein